MFKNSIVLIKLLSINFIMFHRSGDHSLPIKMKFELDIAKYSRLSQRSAQADQMVPSYDTLMSVESKDNGAQVGIELAIFVHSALINSSSLV